MAHVLCDIHPENKVAYRIVSETGGTKQFTYGELRSRSKKLASGFSKMGFKSGDRISTLMSKGEDYLVTLMAIWRLGAIYVPLFTAFARGAIEMRLESSEAKAVICDQLQLAKLTEVVDFSLPNLKIILSGPTNSDFDSLEDIESSGDQHFESFVGGGDVTVIQIYTSGTTGKPKGVAVPLHALAGFQGYAEFGLGLQADDVFWNAADPGWAYGLYFGVIASLSTGTISVMHTEKFSSQGTLDVLINEKVTNFTAAPTVYRSLKASGIKHEPVFLKCASSAGEPLTPDVNEWAHGALGVEVHDHFGQTESGMIVNNHHHSKLKKPIKQGSMGHGLPGWEMMVVDPDSFEPLGLNKKGLLAVELSKSPFAWFSGYVDAPEKNIERLTENGKWYLSGDIAQIDDEGYFHFSAREDDVIIMAGYRIGPFDVESVLSKHPAVKECAVIALPDEIRGEVLVAAVVLADDFTESVDLTKELQSKVKTEYAAYAFPREVFYLDSLPKTPSGKIQRFIVRKSLEKNHGN